MSRRSPDFVEAEKVAALEKERLESERLEGERREREQEMANLREAQRIAALKKNGSRKRSVSGKQEIVRLREAQRLAAH